jgi:alkylation response protein AidB-like acyl-CoA dehydrogenase
VVRRSRFDTEHDLFRESVRMFIRRHVEPHLAEWERLGRVDRSLFRHAGEAGLLGIDVPTDLGGGGVADFRFQQILGEELQGAGASGAALALTLHTDICMPYFLDIADAGQRSRWLPGICAGAKITAVAMTEPGIGSDLASMQTVAVRDGDCYVLSGSKTFVTNGINADLVIVAAKTDPAARHRGISLIVVEQGTPGFERGRNLDKIGLHSQDTAELFFADVRVPVANRLGEEGEGFRYLMANLPRERLSIAVSGVAAARAALDWTLEYTHDRQAFGHTIDAFQNTRFRLAEMATEIAVAQSFVDDCVGALNAGELTTEDAAMAKWWCTELQGRVVDTCLQLHGGYGYMKEYPIARAYADARVTRIYGGTTEIMKEVIGRSLVRRTGPAAP